MFEVDSSVKSSLPAKPSSATGFYALVRSSLLTESGFILFFFKRYTFQGLYSFLY